MPTGACNPTLCPIHGARLFDAPQVPITVATLATLDSAAARALARAVATEGIVLLQNQNIGRKPALPLALGAGKTVAIIGPLANDTNGQFGGYTSPGAAVHTVLGSAVAALPDGTKVIHARGCDVTGNDTAGFAAALEAAASADVVIAVVGDTGGVGWDVPTCGEDDDRTQLDLPGMQPELLAAVAAKLALGTPLVVVLIHGRPVSFVRHQLYGNGDIVFFWRFPPLFPRISRPRALYSTKHPC